MAYCTQSDLSASVESTLLVDLTDDLGAGSIDAAKITRAIADADSVIDGYARGIYSVPIPIPLPTLIRKLSVDLSLYNLFSRRGSAFELPAWIETKHKDAMSMLRDIRDGKIDLGVEPPPSESTAQVADYSGNDQLFNASTMEEF
jgi:phage gp36-like protein